MTVDALSDANSSMPDGVHTPQGLIGIVLGGGRSRRMGQDKAALAYHGVSQLQYGLSLLNGLVDAAYVSCRSEQRDQEPYCQFTCLADQIPDQGPLGGVLTALNTFPGKSLLVMACDLPFLDRDVLNNLIAHRNQKMGATAYLSNHDGRVEPLCAIWEHSSREEIQQRFDDGLRCARRMLEGIGFFGLALPRPEALDNMNHPEEKTEALRRLQGHAPGL